MHVTPQRANPNKIAGVLSQPSEGSPSCNGLGAALITPSPCKLPITRVLMDNGKVPLLCYRDWNIFRTVQMGSDVARPDSLFRLPVWYALRLLSY